MSPIKLARFELNKEEYQRGIDNRVMPEDLEFAARYVARLLTLSQSPYALEVSGRLSYRAQVVGQAWDWRIGIDYQGAIKPITLLIDQDGFAITRNSGKNRVLSLPEGYIRSGYLLC